MRTFPKLSKTTNEAGHYEIRWSEEENGKWRSRRRSTKTGDRAGAEAQLAKFLTLRDATADTDGKLLVDLAEAYFRQHSRPKGTEKSDRQNLRAPLGAFGDWPPSTIKHADVDAYARGRARGKHGTKPVKPATIRREIVALQAMLNWCSDRDMIRGRPTFKFHKPSENYEPRDRWLTEDQERDVLDRLNEASTSVQIFTRLGLTYAVRKGAMMDLRFGPQVNFLTNIIDFNDPKRPKVRKRRSVVPMTRTIRAGMEQAFKGKAAGDHVLDRNTPHQFKRFMEGIGYGWVTPHVLKHTAITLMLRQGVPPGDVAKLTATDLRTIYRTYRHHTQDELLTIAEGRGI